MAYTDDAVKAKLSSLNETQDSIVGVAQWIMFHRRQADRTAQLWMQRLKDSPASKRLTFIYLANEVVQQSKARKKIEFAAAFSPIIAEGAQIAYRGAPYEIQQKIRRVIEVWRSRAIFEPSIQIDVEKGVDEIDKQRPTGKKSAFGGSLFSNSSSSAPAEIQPLVPLQTSLSKVELAVKPAVSNADTEYEKLTNPANPVPTPPVHAARLAGLLKTLATAEGAVAESIKARQALIARLEKLLNTNKAALAADETKRYDISNRKTAIEARKREVEDGIMRGLSVEAHSLTPVPGTNSTTPTPGYPEEDLARPDVEALTPPPVESITPMGTPPPMYTTSTGADAFEEQLPNKEEPAPSFNPGPVNPGTGMPGLDLLSSLAMPQARVRSEDAVNGGSVLKRRRIGSGSAKDEFAEFATGDALEGLDDDVAEMLGRD